MTKENLIKKISSKYNVLGDVSVVLCIKNPDGSTEKCNMLGLDDNELCMINEDRTWVYPLDVLTKRELESVSKQVNAFYTSYTAKR